LSTHHDNIRWIDKQNPWNYANNNNKIDANSRLKRKINQLAWILHPRSRVSKTIFFSFGNIGCKKEGELIAVIEGNELKRT
jgi:hypothetical protein